MKSSHQQQQPPQPPVIPLPPNSQLLKLVLCFFLSTFAFGCGIIFSSNIQTSPVISLETIKLYLPSTLLPPPPPPPPPPQHKTPPSPPPPPPPPPPPQSKQPHLGLKDHVKPKILMRPRSPPPPLMKKSHLGPKHHVEPKVLMPPRSPPPPLLKKSKDYVEQKVLMHHMKDDQLLKMASMVPKVGGDAYKGRTSKVAFMFLIKGELPFAPIWEKFFKGHQGLYSIYLHMDPSYNRSTPKDSVFYGRRVPSKPVHWGRVDMMEAERRLLANALLDYNNQRFVLLSESCVPIFNFSTVYSYLINSTQTFVQVIDELGATGRGRYSIKMLPQITQEQWRKGSQWFEIDREIAIAVVSDKIYFPVFRKYCKGTCYTDEHYLPTLVYMHFPYKNANRSLTWVDWSRGGPHPLRYARTMVTVDLLKEIRGGSSCVYNGEETSMCHMFARKFLPNALTRFEMFSRSIMGFG